MASKEGMIMFIICFWSLLIIFSNMFEVELTTSDFSQYNPDRNEVALYEQASWTDFLKALPVLNLLLPLANIMTFQYNSILPEWVGIILNITFWSSILSIYLLVRGN